MKKILTITMNPAIDKSTSVGNVVPDRKLRCRTPVHEPGGGGLNVSRAIAKLGGSSSAIYTSGGPPGNMLQQLLEKDGITLNPISIHNWTRQNLTVIEESSGSQYRFGMPGPELADDEWRACLKMLPEMRPVPDLVVASGSLPPGVPEDFYSMLVRAVEEMGSRVVVDTSGPPLRLAAREGVFLLKPNLHELRELAGRPIPDEKEQEGAARELVEKGKTKALVLSLGAAGALLVTEDGTERMRTPTVPIKSKIGAGDSMVAGIVLALARDWPVREAVRYGIAAGAAAVMTPGTELCRREDTERLYGEIASQ